MVFLSECLTFLLGYLLRRHNWRELRVKPLIPPNMETWNGPWRSVLITFVTGKFPFKTNNSWKLCFFLFKKLFLKIVFNTIFFMFQGFFHKLIVSFEVSSDWRSATNTSLTNGEGWEQKPITECVTKQRFKNCPGKQEHLQVFMQCIFLPHKSHFTEKEVTEQSDLWIIILPGLSHSLGASGLPDNCNQRQYPRADLSLSFLSVAIVTHSYSIWHLGFHK